MTKLSNLLSILDSYSVKSLIESFEDGTFERYVPGCSKLVGCDQGSKDVHFEGAVHIHTAMVIKASREIQKEDPLADYDDADLLAALLHDIEKPACRCDIADGRITFPSHEAKGALRMWDIAQELALDLQKTHKLHFLVENHGKAHELPRLPEDNQRFLVGQPYWRSLRILQRADAESCWTTQDGSSCMPIYWDLFADINKQISGSEI